MTQLSSNDYRNRMLNVVRSLREAPDASRFWMGSFGHESYDTAGNICGTPACALGHYAFRTDLQDYFSLQGRYLAHTDGTRLGSCTPHVNHHFGLDYDEDIALFGGCGCNCAQTIQQAITYIEAFIARKWPLPAEAPEMAALRASLLTTEVVPSAGVPA